MTDTLDFVDRTYTAEVVKTAAPLPVLAKALSRVTYKPIEIQPVTNSEDKGLSVSHSFVTSERPFHRVTRVLGTAGQGGRAIELPRRHRGRGGEAFLYDVIVAHRNTHLLIAVPFHGLAEEIFAKVDKALGGTKSLYEKLNITKMVIELGVQGQTAISDRRLPGLDSVGIALTRCQLVYSDPKNRDRSLQQVRIAGTNIGNSEVYEYLAAPVLKPTGSPLVVTPTLLGVGLFLRGVKRAGIVTDRHGNFKFWVGSRFHQICGVFDLLAAIETIHGAAETTSNLPILQSKTIRDAEQE